MNIVRSGFLAIDPCGKFARIVFSNGGRTGVLVTKRQALEAGEAMLGLTITEDEWLIIKQQICDSDLLDKHAELERAVAELEGNLDELRRRVGEVLKKFEQES